MAGLRVEDVGLNTLTVAQSVWGQRVQSPKTQNAVRRFAISAGLRKEIKEMVDALDDVRNTDARGVDKRNGIRVGCGGADGGLLFPTPPGRKRQDVPPND